MLSFFVNVKKLHPLNHSSKWQVLLVCLPIILGVIYALPNLYREYPTLQISTLRNHVINKQFNEEVLQLLSKNQIIVTSYRQQSHCLEIFLPDSDTQHRAYKVLNANLHGRCIVAENLLPSLPYWLSMLGASPMKLGLDIRGGVYFLLAIDDAMLLAKAKQKIIENIRHQLFSKRLTYRQIIQKKHTEEFSIVFKDPQIMLQAKKILITENPQSIFDPIDNLELKVAFSKAQRQDLIQQAVQQNTDILRKRIDQSGVSEAIIQRQGTQYIVVELPGLQNIAQAKNLLGSTASLEFHLVNQTVNLSQGWCSTVPYDTELYKDCNGQPVALYKAVALSGDHITHARATFNSYNNPQVDIVLDSSGGKQMELITQKNIGKPLAAVLIEHCTPNNTSTHAKQHAEVISLARIKDCLGRYFCISGSLNIQQARHLSMLLRSGALITPLHIIEERIIGPTLGKKNIQQGIRACCVGLVISMLFMIFYYKKFGIIATIGLIANLSILIGILSILPGTTLTLPAIAGIVLTLGMAVDSNVLIFERIKEELLCGKTVQLAIEYGYRNAFSSIADANVTTLIINIILYMIGNGPIKGFATTLSVGLATSMFTAIVVTRTIVNRLYGGKPMQKLSI